MQIPSRDALYAAIDGCGDAVCFVDLEGQRIVYANRSAQDLLGYEASDWGSLTLGDVVSENCVEPRAEPCFVRTLLRHRDGRLVPARWCLVAAGHESIAVALFQALPVAGPVSENDRDPLTGLPNRTVFECRLQESLKHQDTGFAVMFLDLDGFKAVNDSFGHLVGDEVLRELAGRLRHALRPDDLVARYGGDEFTMILRGVESVSDATNAADRLLRRIEEPIRLADRTLTMAASIGIALWQPDRLGDVAVVEAADRAMYRAKVLGAGRYVVFDPQECPPFGRSEPSTFRQQPSGPGRQT